MKKQLLLLLMILLPLVAMADISGSCGPNVTYTYVSSTNTLTIQGSGVMNDYKNSSDVPWYSYRSNIKTVVIENGVTSIGNSAFYGCSSLTSVNIPNGVTSIGDKAFTGCSKLKKVIVPDIAAWCRIKLADNPLFYAHHLYSDENTEIKDLVIPSGITSISDKTFYSCYGLSSVTIGNNVSKIGSSAFQKCTGLSSVTIGNSVKVIDALAFDGCTNLKKVIVPDIAAWCDVMFGDNPLSYAKHLYIDENTEITDLEIPNSVVSISEYAFSGCSSLINIVIPNSVLSIGAKAFYNCSSLSNVAFPNSLRLIDSRAFSRCSSLTSIEIPYSVTTIGDYAFSGCSSLTSVTLNSESIVSAKRNRGYYDIFGDQVTKYIIGDGVIHIGERAFSGCSGLTSISIGNSVKDIGRSAFSGCSGLTSITIPNSVTDIEAYAFYDCRGLSYVIIGNSVTSIGESAFVGEDISSVISLIENPFPIITYSVKPFSENTYKYATLYVPKGTTDMYKSTEGWKYFVTIMEGNTSGIATISKNAVLIQNEGGAIHVQGIDDGTRVNVYNTDGTQLGSSVSQNGAAIVNTNLQPGSIAIVKIGDKSVKVVVK